MKSLGIVGWSPFNELLIRNLAPYSNTTVLVASRSHKTGKAGGFAEFAPVKKVLQCDVVIPSIPSQYLPEFLSENAQYINPKALVIDVCSVKVRPVEAMLKYLPKSVEILATHPLFGPGSAKDSLEGHRIMMHPVRIPSGRYEHIKRRLTFDFKLKIVETTPEEHDKAIAYVLGLTQSIGRIAQSLEIPKTELTTTAYDDLLDMKRIQGTDSWELYESIMLQNDFALGTLDSFIESLIELRAKLTASKEVI